MTERGIRVPEALGDSHLTYFGESGRSWVARLPALAADCLDRWHLRLDGTPRHGAVALVLPVIRADGTPAVLKLQPVDDETVGEPAALRAWAGDGAVSLLESDPGTGAMLLECLDAGRSLASVEDDLAALRILSEILARLVAVPAPPGLRRLTDIATRLLDAAPGASARLADPAERRLMLACAAAVDELKEEPGHQLLHWDLHYDNVLAPVPGSGREPWLAIDPKPLVGDPGFELLPALWNRWHDVEASGDIRRAVRRRFDLMTEVVGLDRQSAAGWTLGRVLQNAVWSAENGDTHLHPIHAAVARALLP